MRDSMGIGLGFGTGIGVGQGDKNNIGDFGANPSRIKEGGLVGGDGGGAYFGGSSDVGACKPLEEDASNSLILIQDSLINLSFSEQV